MRRDRPASLRIEIASTTRSPHLLPQHPLPHPLLPARRVTPLSSPLTPIIGTQRLPTELWWRILRLATDISLDKEDLPTFEPPATEPLSVRRTKRAIVQVCSTWRDIGTPFLYEYLAPENHVQALCLHALLSRRPQLGKLTKHIAFSVHASYNDIQSHISLVAKILLLVPAVVSVHFILLSSVIPSTSPDILGGSRTHHWDWKALHWIDTTVNDPRSFERMLNRCPRLEQLHFSGNSIVHLARAPHQIPLPRLRMLAIRDAGVAALEMVSSWSMPRLTHLSVALRGRDSIESLARVLFERHGPNLTFLRLDGFGMPTSILTSFIALCPQLEEMICRAGLAMPDQQMTKLRRVGLLRPSGPGSGAVRAEHLRTFSRLRSLQIFTAVEDARFVLSEEEALSIFGTDYLRIAFVDAIGEPIPFAAPLLVP